MTPQVLVTLSPQGTLQAELPGPNGARRVCQLKPGQAERDLLEILHGQLARRVEIGEDGAPTQAQVKHWEEHGQWPDSRCAFCRAEGKSGTGGEGARKVKIIAQYAGVVIRQVPSKARGKGRRVDFSTKGAEEMGL